MSRAAPAAAPVRAVAPDSRLALAALALLLIGFFAVGSASVEYAAERYGDAFRISVRHLQHIAAALAAAAVVFAVPPVFWRRAGGWLLLLSLALLALVLVPGLGIESNGSRRWLDLGPVSVQASEFAKWALIVYLAGYLHRREEWVRGRGSAKGGRQSWREGWRGFAAPLAVVAAMALLLALEPDFGAAAVILGTALGMLFLGGVRLSRFLLALLGGAAALAALLASAPYRVQRLTAFFDPWADPFDSGYQLTQSLIAFGRGGWTGVGLGNSVQKLSYLPEAHTDFVFAIWAEETGCLGALAVIGLFAALVLRLLGIARRRLEAGDRFGAHVCNGAALVFAAQSFINMGACTGLLPTKGLTLPLISYGGSSLFACLGMLALACRVEWQGRCERRGGRQRERRYNEGAR